MESELNWLQKEASLDGERGSQAEDISCTEFHFRTFFLGRALVFFLCIRNCGCGSIVPFCPLGVLFSPRVPIEVAGRGVLTFDLVRTCDREGGRLPGPTLDPKLLFEVCRDIDDPVLVADVWVLVCGCRGFC